MKAATVAAPERIARQPDSVYRPGDALVRMLGVGHVRFGSGGHREVPGCRGSSAAKCDRAEPGAAGQFALGDADRAWMWSTPGKCWIRLG
ncbi:hypothetical protein [Nocardia sp. NPDC050412]|uniref:hypothetical protein n=1 Tax=Nocardia sp. NPDC050412 TaxID=3364320 RepID=UPI0037B4441E